MLKTNTNPNHVPNPIPQTTEWGDPIDQFLSNLSFEAFIRSKIRRQGRKLARWKLACKRNRIKQDRKQNGNN